jgi:amino acid permease
MKKHKFLIISILTFILFIVFFSEYNANQTKKILDAERIKADERLRIVKEKNQQKDSTSIDIDSTFNNID